jgi:glycosyltransferase involved in cell wall biosynthesis
MLSFLFLDTERVWRGGQDQLLTLLNGLINRGHNVHLVCQPGSVLEERARRVDVAVHPIAIRNEIDLLAFIRLVSLIRQIQPQILAFNTPRPIFLGNLASRLTRVRARIIFRRVNFPLRRSPITRLKYTWGIDCIIAISASIKSQLLARGLPAGLIRTVYEGMDIAHFRRHENSRSPIPGAPVVVGTLAHLSPEKGIDQLIKAAALIPDVGSRIRFVIVGEGKCRADLEQQVIASGLDKCFQFAGFQEHTRDFLEKFDIFVLPSLSEGLSSAILSAMASGLPVVATNVGGIPELVQEGENGLLVPSSNPAALAKAIARLADDPAERSRMGQRGRMLIEEKFTLERKIVETERLCRSLLGNP